MSERSAFSLLSRWMSELCNFLPSLSPLSFLFCHSCSPTHDRARWDQWLVGWRRLETVWMWESPDIFCRREWTREQAKRRDLSWTGASLHTKGLFFIPSLFSSRPSLVTSLAYPPIIQCCDLPPFRVSSSQHSPIYHRLFVVVGIR